MYTGTNRGGKEIRMKNWWENYPWRNIQTNLREIDMEDIDAKEYVKEVKELGATVVLLNAAGTMASYDTQLADQAKCEYLHGSSLEEIVDECHKAGIRVFCRADFSKIRRDIYEKHPDWAFRTAEGGVVDSNGYISTCINSDYQKIYMHEILREVFEKIPFDGLFCNMSGMIVTDYYGKVWGFCQCERCKKKFFDLYGEQLPQNMSPGSPGMLKLMAFKDVCEKEYADRLKETMRKINPQILVGGQDYIRSESNCDIKRPAGVFSASSNARRGSGPARMRIADNSAVDFMGFGYRHISVSPELMELRQWQNLANSGKVSVFIMGRPGNHKDRSWHAPTKKVFDFHKKHEKLYTGMYSDAKVALVYAPGFAVSKETLGWMEALTMSHIPFDEIYVHEMGQKDRLDGKEVLILGDLSVMSDGQCAMVDSFVQNGGTVIVTGKTSMMKEDYTPRKGFGLRSLGVTLTGSKFGLYSTMFELSKEDEEIFCRSALAHFIAPGSSMTQIRAKEKAETYLHVIPEHPFGPPELCYYTKTGTMPGVVSYACGSGKSVYIPFLPGDFYKKCGHQNTLDFMQDILFDVCGIAKAAPGLSPMVELNVARTKDQRVVQLINASGCFGNHFLKPLPEENITVRISARLDGRRLTRAEALNGGTVILEEDGDELLVHLDCLNHYEAVVLS